jgi:outer membrane biosynthesis protein TonB
MNASASQPEQPLVGQIEEAQEKLGGLERNLSALDDELAGLARQRAQYELLAQTCRSLEQLRELGADELFWGKEVDRGKAAERVREIHGRVDEFLAQVSEIEARRQGVVEEIKQGREVLDILEDDLLELREEEEERQNEWIVEREMDPLPDRQARMPWTRGGEEDRRYHKTLGSTLAAALLLGLLLPLVNLPLPKPTEIIEVPERLTRLIREQRERPPPPPPIAQEQKPEEKKPEETKPEEPKPKETKPAVAEQPPEKAPSGEAPAPQPKRAASSGILAFRESLSNLADNLPSARLGSAASISNKGDAAVGRRPERAMVTSLAPGSSGGINIGSLSRDVGGGGGGGPQLAGVQTTRVENTIGGGGGAGGDRPFAGSGAAAGRTDEEIQIVFDRYKASLYRLYNRELRKDPTLRGQMVLHLTIEPDGSVSLCELQSTDMNAPDLVQQVLERVRTFDFGAKDVAAITISYPIDFLPAA